MGHLKSGIFLQGLSSSCYKYASLELYLEKDFELPVTQNGKILT